MSRAVGSRIRRGCTAIGLALAVFGGAQAAILDNSIALDAVYIPALSLTVSAAFVMLMSWLILYETSNIINCGETNYVMATVSLASN